MEAAPLNRPGQPAATPALSVITVFWNGRDDLDRYFGAWERAREALPFAVEVIAVDNASQDGTADEIGRRFPWARLIRNARNEGFAPGCNHGLEQARGDLLLLLNPDCEADAAAIGEMVAYLRAHARAGAVGCTLLHGDGHAQHSHHREPSWWSYWGTHSLLSPALLRLRKLLFGAGGTRHRALKVDWLMGACIMVPRAIYEAVGGLDPEYFMYSEDADWCRRIRDAGFDVVHLPGPRLVHHHGTSARRRREFTFRRLYRSLLMYQRKHVRGAAGVMLRAAVIADMLMRLPIHAARREEERVESVRRVLAMFRRGDPTLFPEDAPAAPQPDARSGTRP